MAALDLAASFANGDRTLPLLLQAVLLVFQEDVGEHGQRPQAQDGGGAHQLIVIQAQFLFAGACENLDVPARRDMGKQRLGISLQIDFWPRSAPARARHPRSVARSPPGSGRAYEPRWR